MQLEDSFKAIMYPVFAGTLLFLAILDAFCAVFYLCAGTWM
jgi:hypothetical protein